jgi:hypothetical protein
MFMGIAVETLTASSLLAIAVLMILSGLLIPRRVYKDKSDEAQRWQLAFEIQRDRSDKLDAQTELLLEQGKATHALITAIFTNSTAIRQSGEQNVVS